MSPLQALHIFGVSLSFGLHPLTQNNQIWRVDIWGAATFGQYPRSFLNGAEPQCSPIWGYPLFMSASFP